MKNIAKESHDRKKLQHEMNLFEVNYRSRINGAVNTRRSNVNTKMRKAYTRKFLELMLFLTL